MPLSPQQHQRALQWVNATGRNPHCNVCGAASSYRINDEPMALFPIVAGKTDFTRSAQFIVFTCARCANVRMFSAAMMGVQ